MANKSLWEQLPKAEQERIKRELNGKVVEQSKPVPKKGQFQLKGYVRCELSSADKDAFRAWEGEHDAVAALTLLMGACDSGYLLKVGESGDGHQASLCAASTGQSWDGFVLTAHSSSAHRAAQVLAFKHSVLMGADWAAWMESDNEDFFR